MTARSLHVVGTVMALLAATPTQQQPSRVAAVSVPAAMVDAVAPTLQKWFGERILIEALHSMGIEPPPGPRLYLLCDEWMLARLAAVGGVGDVPSLAAQRAGLPVGTSVPFVLPFVGEYGLVVASDLETVPRTWEELALHPRLHDRLGIVAPEVDGSPWLLGIRERLDRGDGQAAGFALWTTLDARAGHLAGSYAMLLADLDAGRHAAAVGPRRELSSVVARSRGRLRLSPLAVAPAVRFGLALTAGAGPELCDMAERLTEPQNVRDLAAAAGLTIATPGATPLPAEVALEWWQQFEKAVRGRGRATEKLADWLDLSFGVLFLLCLWLVWRSCRESTPSREG